MSLPKAPPPPSSAWSLTAEQQALLAERVRRGEAGAEEDLVACFQRPVLALLIARTRDSEAARDLTQEVLLGTLLALRQGRLREPERLAAFVACTARNLVFKHLRSRGRALQPLEGTAEVPAPGLAPDALLEAAERRELVAAALAELDERERVVLELTWRQDFSPAQIARQLGVSGDVVRTRKSRALKKVVEYVRERTRLRPGKDSLERRQG
ncbi:MAG TPA: sigma-70 family RNA polymerase sigma factor [Thermoanaerobaculia bacterium]|jgi:RNA polymerase sigma-70 factor (ECF subfamily)|nr:sigma-70 family RNA polymerase sigma factor [Thermoanaerobaculia bacterium]